MRNWKNLPALLLITLLAPLALAQTTGVNQTPVFDHAALHVRDLEKSAHFYETVLGLARTPEPFKDGKHIWYRVGPHQQLHVIAGGEDAASKDIDVHLAFRVADVAAFSAHLDQMKVAHQPYGTRADGVKQVYFQDPDGYWLEVNDSKF
jgi:lactoylglutathione lyase